VQRQVHAELEDAIGVYAFSHKDDAMPDAQARCIWEYVHTSTEVTIECSSTGRLVSSIA
jgi:hypothetical protein